MTQPRVIVLDTSYLDEIYRVPSMSEPTAFAEIRERLTTEADRGSRLYVPVPTVFELANHVTQSGRGRVALARRLAADLRSSLEKQTPWIVVPAKDDDILGSTSRLLDALQEFEEVFVAQSVGLTDVSVVHEARRLKTKYRSRAWAVHIWTRDAQLKAHEPDPEPDPFV